MTVTVHMHGNLRRFMPGGADRLEMTLAVGTTIGALLADLGAERDTWLVAVNGATVETGRVLEAGDLLDCFEPVAGGAEPRPSMTAHPRFKPSTRSDKKTRGDGMTVRFVINTLKPGVEPAAYETWLREYDYRVAKTLPSIISYRTFRIEGPVHNAPAGAAWRYIERIEISDVGQYQKDIASPAGQELIRQLYENYCDRSKTIFFATESIEG